MLPGLVLLHGFTQTGAAWAPVANRVGERYRPLAPDLPSVATWDEGVAWVRSTVVAHGTSVLVGYSMGGRLALAASLGLPLDRLVLIGSTPGLFDPVARAARRQDDERLIEEIEREGVASFASRWGAQPLFASQSPAVASAAHADRLRSSSTRLAGQLRAYGTGVMPSLWDALPSLELPVLLIAGSLDTKFSALAEEMAALLPRGEVALIDGAGHAPQLEDPAAVAALL